MNQFQDTYGNVKLNIDPGINKLSDNITENTSDIVKDIINTTVDKIPEP